MRAFVTLRGPDGGEAELSHGDLIGRLWSAALPIDDARVSEAHAMVSLRGDRLKLLALRGLFSTGRKPVRELTLEAGQRITLARGVVVEVVAVELPEEVLAIEGPGVPAQPITGVCSLVGGPDPALVPGYHEGADAICWSMGGEWRLQLGERTLDLEPGLSWETSEGTWRVIEVPLGRAAQADTVHKGAVRTPLRIVTRFDTVHFHREGQPAVAISGIPARIVSELAAIDAPVSWEVLARDIWAEDDRYVLRRRWDVNLGRLRTKLGRARIRRDLVRADGSGNLELLLYPGDSVVVQD